MLRIDLFLNERELARVCKAIRASGAPGYSVMRHVTGSGERGEISESMDFSSFGANAQVIVFCESEQVEGLRSGVLPLLKRFGGVGFISTAERL